MKNIIVTTVDSSGVIAKHTLSGNGPTVINATKNANYEFFDNAKGYGPDHIITRRVDNDLKVSFERTGAEDDLIIKDFYTENAANNNSALIGASKEGEPYYYIPDSAEQTDFVTQLQNGAVQGNALGGEEFVQPWWIGGLPVLAALGIASIGSSDDSPPPPPPVNPPVVTITEDANNDGIISAGELDGTVGVLIEVHEKTQVGDTLIVTNPDGSVDMIVITQDIKDNGLVLEYPAPANDETIEVKAQVVDYLENASETSSDSAVVESPAIVSLSGDSSVNENNGPATYTISLDKASDTDTVVTYEVQNQTTDSNDFTGATTATVTIPAGQLSVVVEVGINDDGVYEGDENYNVVITGVTGSAELGNDDTVNTVIIDKDMMPSISVDDVTVSESLMGEDVVATFTVTLSHPSTETVEVSFNTEDGTAINGADYTGLSGTVTFVPGETTQTIEVPILDDVYDEEDETFNVVLSSPVNATLDHNGIGTITDEEQYPDLVEVSIVDNYDAVNEGDPAIFPIELRDETGNLIVAATEVTVTVEYTGTAINGDDYTTVSTTVTIPAGASSVNLNIETLTDLLDEGLENVVITVTGATGGGFEALGVDADKCVADVDITDIPHSRVEVNDVIVDEDAGYAEFTVTLTGGIPTADVSVDYATGDVTALNGPDYTGITGTLTFAAGTTVFTQTVQVPIIDDVYAEPYETYDMTLSNSVNATISHSGIGTITDEEQLPDLVEVSIVDNYDAVNEGDTATFPIELRDEAGNLVIAATNVTVTVEYTGTAINGDDYTSVSTTVTILAGESSVNLDIETLTDLLDEDLENVVITVTDATGGGFEALGVDADKCVADVDIIDSSYTTIEIDDVTVDEDAGNAVFTVTLTGDAPTADVTVDYATGDVTALDASDYTGVTGTLVFPLGTLTQTITVPILDDNIAEVAETYSVTLSNAVNATILNGGVGTITDECHTDLDSVYVSIVDNVDSVYEGEVATFTVELRDADGNLNAAITDVTVDIHYSGVAIDGTDYIGVTSVTIPANSSSVDFDITTLDDYIAEGSEIVNIELNSVTGGGFEAIAVDPTKATADMNIVDDCCEAESVVVSILDFVTNVVEGGNGVFPIELHDQDGNPVSAITDTTVDIHYSGVGIDGTDFTGISTIVIPAGSQSNYLVLETIDDNFAEGSELVNIELFNVSGGGFEAIAVDPDHNTADMNIVDDCDSVFVSILDFTTDVIEASSGLFPIVLKDADGNAINAVTDITVNIEYSGVAIDGTDFTGIASVVIPAGAQSTNLILQTLDDNIAEGSEIVNIELTSVSGGGFETIALDPVMYVADMNIVDDCNYPVTVSIFDDVDSIYEGELASFPIYLTNVDGDPQVALTDVTVTIEYTGSATNGDDYTGSFTVVIPAGASSVDLDIASLEDLLAEGDEIVDITISNPMGGGFEVIGVNPMADTANVTIKDSTIQITVEPSEAFEGDDLVHMVTLSNPSMTDETYSFSLTEGTATENVDYSTAVSFSDGVTFDAVTGEITVPAGVTRFTVTYPTIDDSYADDGETTTLTIGGSSATGTINDEYPPDLVEVSIVDNVDSIYEGTVDPDNIGSFPIELRDQNGDLITAATDVTVDVTYSGTADNGDDFTGVIQVTIPAGQSSVNLDLTVIDDLLAEDDEIVDITISNPVGGGFESIGVDSDANTADMTIINDDYITDISIDSQSVNEEDGTMTFTVTLSGPAAVADVTVDYATADVTAVDGTDYTNTMGTLTFTPGTLTQTITVPIIDDAVWEATETFDITLSNPSTNANILNSGIGTIVDNDLLAVDDSAAAIEAGGINNGSGSEDATGNVLTNDNPDQTDAIVTDIRVGGVEGSGTAGTLGTALVGTYGTLTVNADGTYVYEVNDDDATVQALNDGDSLTESFNYTMTDGTGSDIAVLEIVIKGSNDCAIPTVTSVTVSEEGLTEFDPIPDTTGNNDTTDSAVATGSISFTDVDNFDANDFSIDLAGPTDITVKGETVSWTWDDLTGQLTGQVVIEGESLEVMTVDVGPITTDGSGGFVADYNTTLLHAIDHPSNDDEDQLDVQFEASVSDGTQSASTNFAVTVEDDRPAQSQSNIDIAAATSDSNITIILDTSGSMSTEISGGETRLDFAKAAIVKLLDGYDVAGDVKVQLITFAKEAQAQPQWMTIDELKASLPGITPGGGTNYDAALDVTMTSYDNAGGIFGANNYSYFLTDGEPTFGQGTVNDFDPGLNGTGAKGNINEDNGIQAQEETLWTTFLNANDIKSYAFAFGPDFDESTIELDPIAYDGQIGEQGATDLARIVTDLDELDDILIDTLPDVIDYGLVNGNLFGADEGHVLTFTLDGITYDYDGSDGSMVASSPSSDIYSYDQSTTTVIINTQTQGVMTLDFETGKYTYETQSLVVDYQEDITFTLIDDDGDSVESTQTIFVYSLSAKDDSVITNDTTGILELDQAVLVGNDNTSPNSEVTTTFDVNGGQTSGVDPVIYTTTDFSGVNSFDYTISENDVSSSALVSIEYQQGDTGTVQGTNASETLVGREGLDDTLLGMDGNDILQGKSGDDVLTGGLGEDTFIWTKNDIDGVSTPDLDIITDFEAGDKLNLSDLLQGETIGDAANLADYLNWDAVTEVLSVSADGNFSGGYSAAQSDLNIQIDNYAGDFNNLVDNHII